VAFGASWVPGRKWYADNDATPTSVKLRTRPMLTWYRTVVAHANALHASSRLSDHLVRMQLQA
jgi:hypothetical protein